MKPSEGEVGKAADGRVRVSLPTHLRRLAGEERSVVELRVDGPATLGSVLDALERDHPMLRGTIRDHGGGKRRAFVRFYAGGEDLSHEPQDAPLPEAVASGAEVLRIIGAIAGG